MKHPRPLLSKALLLCACTLLGCQATRRGHTHTHTQHTRVVKDTVVVTRGVYVQQDFACGDTLRLDTGRLRLHLQPLPAAHAGQTPLRYRLQAGCTPDTVRIPGLVRETLRQHCHCPPARNAFLHWSGVCCWAMLGIGLLLFFFLKK